MDAYEAVMQSDWSAAQKLDAWIECATDTRHSDWPEEKADHNVLYDIYYIYVSAYIYVKHAHYFVAKWILVPQIFGLELGYLTEFVPADGSIKTSSIWLVFVL